MFDPQTTPRIFGVPPGADFARALVTGLHARMRGQPPEAMARVQIYLNTRRMQRRVQEIFCEEGALLLPRLHLVTDLAQDLPMPGLPAPVPGLRRRLELMQLVSELLARAPDLAPRAAIYDLADSLAALMEEMQGEGVGPEALERLDLNEHARHWDRALRFLRIVTRFLTEDAPPDAEALRRRVVRALAAGWQAAPPDHPILVAGSTGSRGTTALFMRTVAALPQGALVLPGFDFDLPAPVWSGLTDATTAEDHPQYRFRRLMEEIGFSAETVTNWARDDAPDPARNRLISLSLRPAPVTDQWMQEGRALRGLGGACARMSLIEAPGPRAEALAIALCLREAAEHGRRACLISPDRILTRQVTAALGRWAILPDDSAGRPLGLSPPGRLLRHVAALFGRRLTAEQLLIVLKHPLTHSGSARGPHLLHTRELELHLRRYGPVFPRPEDLRYWADKRDEARPWADWLAGLLEGCESMGDRPLADHIADHRRVAEALAQGPEGEGAGTLWDQEAGTAAREVLRDLAREADVAGSLSPTDYANLFASILSRQEVREAVEAHPLISIHGPREARELGADLVILGGLNDGIWPALPAPDPWLNRQMRMEASLLLPERQVGLSAHDYQIAVAAPQVVLTRALRDAEAQTVPSRWVNRLTNLLGGLDGGPEALTQMRDRGARWLTLAAAIESPAAQMPAAGRPAPRPPVAARPAELPVTRIQTLIRDPYAIYARYILRLQPLDPLRAGPDPRLRGSVLHLIFERFRTLEPGESLPDARARLLAITEAVLDAEIPWPAARRLWRARLERVADWFLMREAGRKGAPVLIERKGSVTLEKADFRLTARPDRIDRLPDGRLHLLDYKTGNPPTPKQQQSFDKQLLLEAAMAERGGFADLGPAEVARITYIGLGSTPKEVETEITPELTEEVWHGLERLIGRYQRRETGYAARRAMFKDDFAGDYDHLARYGEWDLSDLAAPEDVGEEGA
ncbi:helicase [Defluviimonas sp. 20V17]|uniref:Double-strand break repair protein AddB n=1 Tax=Allgaiera indica TaxID=765699 RepID=A0AAN4ZXM8_9RHOB|nr:double-strand break repair protein AddB [Allgaiera indica]KDB03613.1 helicase [Defluviimonas sp. 20V17]GHD98284.1 double-strand break repair protein AddB [Allgaiera indica]SDW50163.1 double-strand break repair protein AddB [Allgaiera indica]